MFPMVIKNRQFEFGAGKKVVRPKKVTKKYVVPKTTGKTFSQRIAAIKPSPNSRIIEITGTCDNNVTTNIFSDTTITSLAKTEFVRDGWNVLGCEFSWNSSQKKYYFTITVDVLKQYSLDVIAINAKNSLNNVVDDTLGWNYFTNIKITLRAVNTQLAPAEVTTISNTGSKSNTKKENESLLPDLKLPEFDFLSALGGGIGLTTPIVLLGAGVIALIILRK